MTTPETGDTRAGFVAIVGPTNAGKSTLLNRMVGAKVSIVTHKVQTTRSRVRGVAMHGDAQIVFVDTPGIFRPRRRLDRAMVDAAWAGAEEADVIVLVIDAAKGLDDDAERIVATLEETKRRAILAINKIDTVKREALLEVAAAFAATGVISETFMISAVSGDGIDDLMDRLATLLPRGPWLYPPDQLSDITERLLAAEITREKLYLRLHQELPYQSAVVTEGWEERKDGSLRIDQTIYVERESQRPIVLGKGGGTIKQIGKSARNEMESLFDRTVHLFLHVKVDPKWAEDRAHYRELGLEFPE